MDFIFCYLAVDKIKEQNDVGGVCALIFHNYNMPDTMIVDRFSAVTNIGKVHFLLIFRFIRGVLFAIISSGMVLVFSQLVPPGFQTQRKRNDQAPNR